MLIGVVYWAANCPICVGKDYYGLQWFTSRKEIINWFAEKGQSEFFINEFWDAETKEKLTLTTEYTASHHHYIGIKVLENGETLAFIKRDSYNNKKKWIIEYLDEELEYSGD